ncbi:MAG: glycogen-binding domain-containing protein [Candidatus Omnitrophota bacterium]
MPRLASAKPKEFKLFAPQAKKVSLAGSFNNWNQSAVSAKKDVKGSWSAKVSLKPGKYEYKFFVDGSWVNDPGCKACVPNAFGTHNCVVVVR